MAESSVTSVEHVPGAVIVHVQAKHLGKEEVEAVCAAVDQARLTAPMLPFILDMAKADFAGSLAMGVLIGLNKEFKNRGQRLIFVNIVPNLRQAIAIVRMDRLIEIMDTIEAAINSSAMP